MYRGRRLFSRGESFLAGLEVRVAFGGVWKESLTELSGRGLHSSTSQLNLSRSCHESTP